MKATAVGKPIAQERMLSVLRFSPDDAVLYGASLDGFVCRWTGDKFTALPPLKGHAAWVQALAIHPDGRVFSGDSWGRLIVWKGDKAVHDFAEAHPVWIRKLAVSPDGKTLASSDSSGVVRLWDAMTLKRTGEVNHGLDVLALTWAPDGTLLYGDLKGVIVHRDLTKEIRRFETTGLYKLDRIQDVGGVRALAVSPDGKTLAVGGSLVRTGGFVQGLGQMTYFDLASGKQLQTLTIGTDTEGYVLDLHWHSSGTLVGITSGQPGSGRLFFHKPEQAALLSSVNVANGHSLAMTKDGSRLVTMSTQRLGGNGRGTGKDYPTNTSPLHVFQVA